MKRNHLSTEYDIRRAVVMNLLAEGIERKQIRIEIPLDTASSMGRADILVLTEKIGCIELKSGRDKYCPAALTQQLKQYKRSFDSVISIVDLAHKREKTIERDGRTWTESNWRGVDIDYDFATKTLSRKYYDNLNICHTLASRNSIFTSVFDMSCLLWANEIRAFHGKTTKCGWCAKNREYGTLNQTRHLVISALFNRPLNKWEEAFWQRFDAESAA